MKTTNLYDILGVPRDAKPRDIKAAYRKRAAAAHPDKGGSDEALQAINQAWEILGDPEKRRRYDETGEMAGAESMTSPGEVLFLQVLDEMINEMLMQGEGNLLKEIQKKLASREKEIRVGHRRLQDRIELLEKQLGRFTIAAEENLIESRLKNCLAELNQALASLDKERSATSEAIALGRTFSDSQPDAEPSRHSSDLQAHIEFLRSNFSRKP